MILKKGDDGVELNHSQMYKLPRNCCVKHGSTVDCLLHYQFCDSKKLEMSQKIQNISSFINACCSWTCSGVGSFIKF